MPKKYGPNLAPGDIRDRCFRVTIDCPNLLENHEAIPVMQIEEEQAVLLSDGATEMTVRKGSDHIDHPYDGEQIIALRDPTTDQPTGGTMTGAEVFAVIYSAVRQVQTDKEDE
jgi:hypothetical protein